MRKLCRHCFVLFVFALVCPSFYLSHSIWTSYEGLSVPRNAVLVLRLPRHPDSGNIENDIVCTPRVGNPSPPLPPQ